MNRHIRPSSSTLPLLKAYLSNGRTIGIAQLLKVAGLVESTSRQCVPYNKVVVDSEKVIN